MNKIFIEKYDSHLLCLSSLFYLLAGLVVFQKNIHLSILLFTVTIFSILYHNDSHNLKLRIFDWLFATSLLLYSLYIRFDSFIFILLVILSVIWIIDNVIFSKNVLSFLVIFILSGIFCLL